MYITGNVIILMHRIQITIELLLEEKYCLENNDYFSSTRTVFDLQLFVESSFGQLYKVDSSLLSYT